MFLTLTPNPCLERTLQLPVLNLNASQRVDSAAVSLSAGGKGLNAARVAARFGAEVVAIAPVGRRQLTLLGELLGSGVEADFVGVETDTRECLNIVHGNGECTEIIESGAPLSTRAGTEMLEKWAHHLRGARLAAIGGSYPPGEEAAFKWHAAILCQMAARAGVPVIYDGRGAAFSRALKSPAPPWAIKPNLAEAEIILGRAIETPPEERRAVRDLRSRGAEVVLLSCGARGLYLGHAGGIEWLEAPRVPTLSSVGCGDTLVGVFAACYLAGAGLLEAARQGVAAASASAAQARPAEISPADAASLLPLVRLQTREIALTAG